MGFYKQPNGVHTYPILYVTHGLTERGLNLQKKPCTITVRKGSEQDISVFSRSLLATGERNDFTEYPEEYWDRFFKLFMPRGYAKIFIAEYEGDVISSIVVTGFNDTAAYKKGGWFGTHKDLHANELLHWEAISSMGEVSRLSLL